MLVPFSGSLRRQRATIFSSCRGALGTTCVTGDGWSRRMAERIDSVESPGPRMPPRFSLLARACPRRSRSTLLRPPVRVRDREKRRHFFNPKMATVAGGLDLVRLHSLSLRIIAVYRGSLRSSSKAGSNFRKVISHDRSA